MLESCRICHSESIKEVFELKPTPPGDLFLPKEKLNLSNEKYLTFNPGIIAGGSEMQYEHTQIKASVLGKTNIISPSVIVEGDLRFLTEQQRENAREKMRAIVSKENLNGTKAKISFTDGIPAMEPTKGNDALR